MSIMRNMQSAEPRKLRLLVAGRLSRLVRLAEGDTSRGAQTGLESQDIRCVDFAEYQGHEIVHVAADYKSGTVSPWNRPNLKPWVTEPAKIAQYDAVLAYKFDRLSRGDSEETAAIEAWARKNNKLLLTVDGLEFPCEGNAGIRWDFAKRQAHQEWLDISERYTRMNETLRGQGFHVGRAPFGYRSEIAPGEKHKRLVIEPREAELIRDVADWYLSGTSLDLICDRLNAEGRLPRRMRNGDQPIWRPSQLSKVLHNEVIAGRQKDGSGKTIAKVEPILSHVLWSKVIERLAERTKRKGISQSKAPALLTSVIYCGECEGPMYRSGTPRNRYYHCKAKGCRSTIRLDASDAFIHNVMSNDHDRDIIETVVPGSGHDAEIADVKRDLAEAVEAEQFERIPALRAELDRLRALPASPTRVERRESDLTVAEMWAGMADDTERRAYLMGRGVRVVYDTASNGLVVMMRHAQTV